MKRILLGLAMMLMCAGMLWAQQGTGQINGTVVDSSGAAIVGASVTVNDPATGLTRSTTTGTTGEYNLTLLPPALYDMTVKKDGFATVQQKSITVAVGQIVNLNQSMKPGATSEVVTVTEEAPLVQTTSSEVGGSVSPTEVKDLPILDRNFSGLMNLIPGVKPAEVFDPTKTKVGNVSIGGGDGRQLDVNVDGGDNKDLVVGGMVQNFTMEGIQEFNVVTDHYTAESGHSVGGVVNVVSKSGTNTIHGSAFGLFQLSTLNKVNYFEQAACPVGVNPGRCKSVYHRYQFGGSLGGALIKDKLFVFGAYENKREPGGLSVNPNSLLELGSFATQSSGMPGGPYAFPVTTLPSAYIDHLLTIRIDHHISDRQTMFYRYGRQRWSVPNDQLGNPFQADGTQSNTDLNNFHDLTIGHTYVISSNKVNSLNLHFQDMVNAILGSPTSNFTYPLAGGGTATNPNLNFPDGTQTGENVNVPQETLIRKYQIRDDFSWTHGRHNMKMGVNWIYFAKTGGFFFFGANGYQAFFWDDPRCVATGSCPGPNGSGGVYAAGLSTPGAVKELLFSGGSGNTAQPPWSSLGWYFQDDFKVTSHLTLNMGLRWDANIGFLRPQDTGVASTTNRTIALMEQALAGNAGLARDADGVATLQQIVGDPGKLHRTTADLKEFQPRIGFAYDPTGTGKMVIRGGYGISRDQIFQNLTLFAIQQGQPTLYQTMFDVVGSAAPGLGCGSSSGTFDICAFRFGIDPFPVPTSSPSDIAPGAVGRIINPNLTDPWAQQWSLGWQYQFHPDYAFSVDYYHVLGTHEERVLNQNPEIKTICDPTYGGSLADPRCVNGASTRLLDPVFLDTPAIATVGRLAQVYEYSTNNRSRSDTINFQLRKRMSHHVQFQATYTLAWNRAWGGFPMASYGGSGLAVTPSQQFAPGEYAPTEFDERSKLLISGIFELPHGFQISPIFQAASARPYSFLAGTDINGDGRSAIDRVCVGSTVTAPVLTPGCTMLPPMTLRGKPFVQMDLRGTKTFRLGERARFNLYAEVYNLFNRSNFCNDYDETATDGPAFNQPLGFCGGPSSSGFGGGFAVPSLHTQWGFRFEF